MAFKDLPDLSVPELLAAHSALIEELRHRGIVRSKNNPTGDYAEWLVSSKLGLTLETNSAKGFDAVDSSGARYQIKGRRITPDNKSAQLGVIRNLKGDDFDFLVGVVFDKDWTVLRAAKIPHRAVTGLAAFRPHVNGHVMHLRPSVFDEPDVVDVTSALRG